MTPEFQLVRVPVGEGKEFQLVRVPVGEDVPPGILRPLRQEIAVLVDFAYELLAAYNPMTLRQLHYTIFSAAKIEYENETKYYRQLSRATTDARRRYRWGELHNVPVERGIPYDWIVDELREGEYASAWDDMGAYLGTVSRAYRRDLWQDQPNYCEIWSEKRTVLATLRPIVHKYGVTLRHCGGFGSAGMEGVVGYLFEGIEKPIHVYFLGDHDPSGKCIERDIHERVQTASGKKFNIKRLAIFDKDIQRFNLPPQVIKPDDPRTPSFKQEFGEDAATVELDALPVDELRKRVRKAIEGLIDWNLWNRQRQIQDAELKSLKELIAAWPRHFEIPPLEDGL